MWTRPTPPHSPTPAALSIRMMTRILIWASTFQAELEALCVDLAQETECEVLIAAPRAFQYRALSAVATPERPPSALVDRSSKQGLRQAKAFDADVVVVDNNVPTHKLSPRLFMAWHGFGWRPDSIGPTTRRIASMYGALDKPNRSVRWLAIGPTDAEDRIRHGIDRSNIVHSGSSFAHWLTPDSPVLQAFSASDVQSEYIIDLSRPTVLFAFTWHYGEPLSSWGESLVLMEQLFSRLSELGVNALVRLHDRHRYRRRFVKEMTLLADRLPHVQCKFRDSSPNSLVDLLVGDALVSDLSSILTYWYHSQKPTVHLVPRADAAGMLQTRRRQHRRLKIATTPVDDARWKIPPTEVGGPVVQSIDELVGHLAAIVGDSSCTGSSRATGTAESQVRQAFLDRHLFDPEPSGIARHVLTLARS